MKSAPDSLRVSDSPFYRGGGLKFPPGKPGPTLDWSYAEPLLREIADDDDYTLGWAGYVMGTTRRSVDRWRVSGVPEDVIEALLGMCLRGVRVPTVELDYDFVSYATINQFTTEPRLPWPEDEVVQLLGPNYTRRDAAKVFGVAVSTITHWRSSREGEGIKNGVSQKAYDLLKEALRERGSSL